MGLSAGHLERSAGDGPLWILREECGRAEPSLRFLLEAGDPRASPHEDDTVQLAGDQPCSLDRLLEDLERGGPCWPRKLHQL
ncbi:MAG: hypothetical protein ACK55I_43835, partial [bacterium]